MRKNCANKFEIIVLNDDLVKILSRTIDPNFQNINPIAMRADYIRFTFVSEYGGLWLDSDIIVNKDLSFMIDDLSHYNFVAFVHDHAADISSGIFAGNKNNRVCNYLKYLFETHPKFSKWRSGPSTIQWAGPTNTGIEYMKTLIKSYPLAYKTYSAKEYIYPVHWKKSKDYYWSTGSIDGYILNMPAIYLHNHMYTKEQKSMSEKEILNSNFRISILFKKILRR